METIIHLTTNVYSLSFVAAIVAFLVSVNIYPTINFLSKKKNLMDDPVERSAHTRQTPNLGGVGLFMAFTICILIFASILEFSRFSLTQLIVLIAAISILFFIGVRDDLIGIKPLKKISAQSISAALVIFVTDIRIQDLHGLLGIGEISYVISVALTIVLFVFLVNAFNLIDGIDGLAGSIGILVSTIFGIFFLINEYNFLALISLVLIGTIIGFLKFNLSDKNKLFMGDSGSLFIGFLIAYQAVGFLGMEITTYETFNIPNRYILFLAVMAFPILDTVRVFFVRIAKGRHPFSADRQHLHHKLLSLGYSHKQASLLIVSANFLVVALTFFSSNFSVNIQLTMVIMLVLSLGLLPCFLRKEEGGSIKFVMPKL